MTILTLGPEGSFYHEAAVKIHPQKQLAFANSMDELFFRLAEKEILEGVIPMEIADQFVEESISHLMKYDFSITQKTTVFDKNQMVFFSIGKIPSKKTEKNGSAFLIFSDPMVATTTHIKDQAHQRKIPLIKLKNLLLQEGHTPLYFMEVEGHIKERLVQALFDTLSEKFLIKHLGSYPL